MAKSVSAAHLPMVKKVLLRRGNLRLFGLQSKKKAGWGLFDMMAKSLLRLLAIAAGTILAGNAGAADLGIYRSASCFSYAQSTLPAEPVETIKQTLWNNFQDAEAGMNDPRVQGARQPAFVWAMETRWACTAAIGYLDGGHLDEESVQKCDCFHQRYMSLR